VLVFNRMNRTDPNSPYPRAFYPGVADISDAKAIHLKDGQQLSNVVLKLQNPFPSHVVKVRVKWKGVRPPGKVTVMAKADQGDNPAAEKLADGLYQFTLLDSANYSISAWEDLSVHAAAHRGKGACTIAPRMDAAPVSVAGSDADTKEVTVSFAKPECPK
jgi:hypothetical protein